MVCRKTIAPSGLVMLGMVGLLLATTVLFPNISFAQGAIGNTLCNIVDLLVGNLGRAIANLAVIFLGIGMFFGKVSWNSAMAVAVGIALVFGAGNVVNMVAGFSDNPCDLSFTEPSYGTITG